MSEDGILLVDTVISWRGVGGAKDGRDNQQKESKLRALEKIP